MNGKTDRELLEGIHGNVSKLDERTDTQGKQISELFRASKTSSEKLIGLNLETISQNARIGNIEDLINGIKDTILKWVARIGLGFLLTCFVGGLLQRLAAEFMSK